MKTHSLPVLALILAACGGEPAPAPSAAPQPTEAPSAAPAPSPPPTASAAPEPPPTASAKASAAPEAPPKQQSSGRPAVMKSDPSEITDTFGVTPGSKLELGDKEIATLRVPEGSLHTGTNITFKIDARGGKSTGGQVGKIYRILAMIPPSQTPESVDTNGPPFVLELPAGTRKDANLAIGTEDEKGKVKWTIVAPKRIDDARNVAVFELGTLASAWYHVTTKAPSGGK
jgi:hypothetical protein